MVNVGDLLAVLRLQDEMSPAIDKAAENLGTLDKAASMSAYQLTLLGRGLREAGALATGLFTVPIMGAATAILNFGGDFETTTSKLVSLAGVQKGELAGVKQHILDLAPAVGIGPVALAEAMYRVSSTVQDTAVAMQILDIAAKGSAAGLGDANVVASALTTTINSYGPANITASHAIDVLTRAIQDGGAEAKDLAPILANVVPFAAKMGVSLEEVGANFATVTKLGVPASEAITQLTSVFAAMARQTPRGAAALQSVGMSYASLRAEIKEKGLAEALLNLTHVFEGNERGLFSVVGRLEAMKNILATTGAQAETYITEVQRMKDANGVFEAAYKTATETFQFMWKQVVASLEGVAVKLSVVILPIFKQLVGYIETYFVPILEKMAKAFENLPRWAQIAALGIATFLAALGPALIVVGQFILALGNIGRAFGFLFGSEIIAGLTTLEMGIIAVDGSLMVGVGTLNLIIPGWTLWLGLILGVAAAILTWTDNWGTLIDGLKMAAAPLTIVWDLLKGAIEWLHPLWQALYDIGAIIGNSLIIVFNTFKEAGGFFVAVVKDIWENIKNFGQWILDHSEGIGQAILDAILPKKVKDEEEEYWENIKKHAREAVDYLENLRKQTADAAKGITPGAPTLFQPTTVGTANISGLDRPFGAGSDVIDGLPIQIEKVTIAQEKLTAAQKKAQKQVEYMNDAEHQLTESEIMSVHMMEDRNRSLEYMSDKLGISKEAIREFERTEKELTTTHEKMAKAMSDTPLTSLPGKMSKDEFKDIVENVNKYQQIYESTQTAIDKRYLESYQVKKNQIERWVEHERANLKHSTANWESTDALIVEAGQARLNDLDRAELKFQYDSEQRRIKGLVAWREQLTEQLGMVAEGFATLSNVSTGYLHDMAKGVADVFNGLKIASQVKNVNGEPGKGGILAPFFDADAGSALKWAAGIQAATVAVAGAMSVWSSTAQDGSKAAGAFHGAMSGAAAGSVFGPYGAAVGMAAGAIAGLIHTLTAGRRAVEDFAKSFDTVAEGSGFDELHAKLLVLGDAGEQMWIRLTQMTAKGDKAGALRIIAEITAALAKQQDVVDAVKAAGYSSQSDLQAVADKAKAVYDYMVKTGGYTAAQLADAFQKSSDAQMAAMGTIGEAYNKAKQAVTELDGKIKGLTDSIANEAPEDVMGIIESQTRAQIDALKAQRDAAKLDMDQAEKDAKTETERVAQVIQDTLDAQHFHAHIHLDSDDIPKSEPIPGFAGGSNGYQNFGSGTTVRLHGWEKVTPIGKDGGGQAITIINKTYLDGRQVAENTVEHMPSILRDRGIR